MTCVAMIGVGKLGICVAIAMAEKGHTVIGYDINTELIKKYKTGKTDLYEPDIDEKLKKQLDAGKLLLTTELSDAVKNSKIIFEAVQTPHDASLDGSIRFNHVRKDFDYSYLIKSCCDVAEIVDRCDEYKLIVIISTVLPGTTEELIYPEMQKHIKPIGHNWSLILNPSFIAMGTTCKDFVNPEFTLIGESHRNSEAGDILERFYRTLHDKPIMRMKWAECEGTKVFYNTLIGLKIIFANTVMQMCDELGANCDVVTNALSHATDRLISPKYLRGGMGDGGGCLPPGQKIITKTGPKIIESIEKGELVLCRDGRYHRVLEAFKREYDGDVFKIKTSKYENIFTTEHPIHIYDIEKDTVEEIPISSIYDNYIQKVDKWYCIHPVEYVPNAFSGRNDNYYLSSITYMDRTPYKGDVFNLNVADEHNYIVDIGVISNCHPRDNLALSYISDKLGLDYNLFDFVMTVREKQTEWLADNIQKYMQSPDQPVVIMGKVFKPHTNLVGGSPSVLLWNILQERGIEATFYDPETAPEIPLKRPSVYFVGTNWPEFKVFDYAPNSTVIDPWNLIKDVPKDVTLISLGRK